MRREYSESWAIYKCTLKIETHKTPFWSVKKLPGEKRGLCISTMSISQRSPALNVLALLVGKRLWAVACKGNPDQNFCKYEQSAYHNELISKGSYAKQETSF